MNHRMMRQKFPTLSILFLIGLLLPCNGLSQKPVPSVEEQGYADTLLVSGKIVTMDDRSSVPNTPGNIYQAMAIQGKRVMALGTTEEMKSLAGPRTRIVDLGGKTTIPGLIQTHYHLFSRAAAEYGPSVGLEDPSVQLTVVAEETAESTTKKLRDAITNAIRVQRIPIGKWITVRLDPGQQDREEVGGWLYLRKINRRHFDSAIPDHPILIKVNAAQGIFNGAAIAEMTKLFPTWEESSDWENGPGSAADGRAAVPDQGGLTFEVWWSDEPLDKLAEALRLHGLDLQKLGITTVATRVLYPRVIAAYHLLNRKGMMPNRLAYYIESQRGNFFNLTTVRQFYKGMGAPWTTHSGGGEMLWLNGMANESWDGELWHGCLGSDVPAPPEVKAREKCPAPGSKSWESYKAAIVNGWRPVQAHGVGSHGVRLYIQMLEEAMKEGNYSLEYMRGLRTTAEHNAFVGTLPDVMAGVKKFGIILNVKPINLTNIPRLGGDYGERLTPFIMPVKTWIDEGIRVTFEADFTNFWSEIYTLVTREAPLPNSSETVVLNPEQRIDRVTALKMATTWASEYMMAEDTIGTLEPGKYADFTVLDKDFFTIPVDEIKEGIPIAMTGLNGQIVYDRDQPETVR